MRGLIVNPHMTFSATTTIMHDPDPQMTRFWLLFWDKIVNPQLSKHLTTELSDDYQYLESLGAYETYHSPLSGGYFNNLLLNARDSIFTTNENLQPGCWAVAGDEGMWPESINMAPRSLQVQLLSAIAIPTSEVPLYEILEFKVKRRDECDELLENINEIYQQVLSAPDRPLAQADALMRIAKASKNMNDVVLERGWPSAVFDIFADFNIAGAFATFVSQFSQAPTISALAGNTLIAGASISVKSVVGWFNPKTAKNPYRYIGSYRNMMPR